MLQRGPLLFGGRSGTPAQIADALQERFEAYGADGFNIMPSTLPGGLDDDVSLVIPEQRRTGLFPEEYERTTLQENLGLSCPADRFSALHGADVGRTVLIRISSEGA